MSITWTFEFDILEVSNEGNIRFRTRSTTNLGSLISKREIETICACLRKTADKMMAKVQGPDPSIPPISKGSDTTN